MTRDKSLENRLQKYKNEGEPKFVLQTIEEQIEATKKQLPADIERHKKKKVRLDEIAEREERWRRRQALSNGNDGEVSSRIASDSSSDDQEDAGYAGDYEEPIGGIDVFDDVADGEEPVCTTETSAYRVKRRKTLSKVCKNIKKDSEKYAV